MLQVHSAACGCFVASGGSLLNFGSTQPPSLLMSLLSERFVLLSETFGYFYSSIFNASLSAFCVCVCVLKYPTKKTLPVDFAAKSCDWKHFQTRLCLQEKQHRGNLTVHPFPIKVFV